ncbi:hypothetical protein AX16_010242 [Volvariella volvacea WC 439]|nr:hypothetical protein AX16_010242 [Volvariella volvacea WC 439]
MPDSSQQYQHYLPRFVLKRFSANGETIRMITPSLSSKRRSYGTLGRQFGVQNLYVDPNHKDPNHIEKKLSVLESSAGRVWADVEAAVPTQVNTLTLPNEGVKTTMTDKDMGLLQKFWFISWLRHPTSPSNLSASVSLDDPRAAWRDLLIFYTQTPHGSLYKMSLKALESLSRDADNIISSSGRLSLFYYLHTHFEKAVIIRPFQGDGFMLGERRVAWIVRQTQSTTPAIAQETAVYNQVHVISPSIAFVLQRNVSSVSDAIMDSVLCVEDQSLPDGANSFIDGIVETSVKGPKSVTIHNKVLTASETEMVNHIIYKHHAKGGTITYAKHHMAAQSLALLSSPRAVQ